MEYTVAFVGNPNVGKSAWINALSGSDFKVGNWQGVTVEKKEADVLWNHTSIHIIDLPGTHSLINHANEESITANFLRNEHVDLIVNVLDATSLASNLLLTLCLRELQIPMLMILNFMDEVEKYHITINYTALSRRLQIPILPYSAFDHRHYYDVKQAIIKQLHQCVFYYPLLSKGYEQQYVDLYNYVDHHAQFPTTMSEQQLHPCIMRYLKRDPSMEQQFISWNLDVQVVQSIRKDLNEELLRIDYYTMIDLLLTYVNVEQDHRFEKTRKIDRILLHKCIGLPIFFLIFSLILLFVFQVSAPFNHYINFLINDILVRYVSYLLSWTPLVLQHLITKGIIAGVGGVLVFVPVMAILYFMLSILEESGYMARISFLLDRMMRVFHLSGKSFVALLLGFGCNVPAIYATRTLDNEKQRRLTAILIPFMSCGARLPVYVLFASAFFPKQSGMMMLCVYALGIFMALLFAMLFSKLSFMKDDAMFIQELPPYRIPNINVVFRKVRDEVKSYVKKATGIVLWAMIILWGLSYFPNGEMETSYIASASKMAQPIFEPLGFGNQWKSIASLPGGIIAKETIVGYFEQLNSNQYSGENKRIEPIEDIKEIILGAYSAVKESVVTIVNPQISMKPKSNTQVSNISTLWDDPFAKLRAFSFMVYVLLSMPCIMTIQALYHEYGWKLMLLSLGTMFVIPYVTSLFLYQFLQWIFML